MRHQEVDNDFDSGITLSGLNMPGKLKMAQDSALLIALLLQGLDERGVLTITQHLGVEAEIDVDRADMACLRAVRRQSVTQCPDSERHVACPRIADGTPGQSYRLDKRSVR